MFCLTKKKEITDHFEDFKEQLRTFLKERDWVKFHTPKNISMSIAIEAAELMELFQWNDPSSEEVLANSELMTSVRDELADILIYCISMATSLHIDLDACIDSKIARNRLRFPTNLEKED